MVWSSRRNITSTRILTPNQQGSPHAVDNVMILRMLFKNRTGNADLSTSGEQIGAYLRLQVLWSNHSRRCTVGSTRLRAQTPLGGA